MSYYVCPKCKCGFDEKPREGYCWACKVPIVDESAVQPADEKKPEGVE